MTLHAAKFYQFDRVDCLTGPWLPHPNRGSVPAMSRWADGFRSGPLFRSLERLAERSRASRVWRLLASVILSSSAQRSGARGLWLTPHGDDQNTNLEDWAGWRAVRRSGSCVGGPNGMRRLIFVS